PDATGASAQDFVRQMPQLKGMNEVSRNDYLSERAWEFISDNPVRAMQLAVIKVGRTWSPQPLSREFGRFVYVLAAWAFMLPLYGLALVGLWYVTLPRAAKTLLLAPAVYFTVSAAISVGSLRYRVPAHVPISVLAAAGAGYVYERMKAPREDA